MKILLNVCACACLIQAGMRLHEAAKGNWQEICIIGALCVLHAVCEATATVTMADGITRGQE